MKKIKRQKGMRQVRNIKFERGRKRERKLDRYESGCVCVREREREKVRRFLYRIVALGV